MMMLKKQSTLACIQGIRGSWVINPRTRIQENELKNTKKRRQKDKKAIKDGLVSWI
ncbi:hypothetical protein REC12_13940 [Desulfosporosinus sp. PR]|nr:hypothetical protein [Desulfosporosinus sp. PR]